jgi:hypothetical protein
LNTTWFESQPVVERSGLWLRHCVEHLAEQAFAQEKLAHRLHALAESGVARHQNAVGIFTARVDLEQQRRRLARGRLVAATARHVRKPAEHSHVHCPEALALDDCGVIREGVQIAAVEHDGFSVAVARRGAVPRLPDAIAAAGQDFEPVCVCGDAGFNVEAVDLAKVHHRCRAVDCVAEQALQLVHETVQ